MPQDIVEDARSEQPPRRRVLGGRSVSATAAAVALAVGAVVSGLAVWVALTIAESGQSTHVELAQAGIFADDGFPQFGMTFVNYGPDPVRMVSVEVNGQASGDRYAPVQPRKTQTVLPLLICPGSTSGPQLRGPPRLRVRFLDDAGRRWDFGYRVTPAAWALLCGPRPVP